MRGRWFIGSLIICGGLVGCFTPQPVEVSCHRLEMATAIGEEVILSEFSVRAPAGGNWCQGPRGRGAAVFITTPFMGQTLTAPPPPDSVVMTATVLHLDRQEIQSQEELKAFAEAFLTGGYSARMSDEGMDVSKFIVTPKDPRFSLERLDISPDPSHPDACVRYEREVRERDNPQWPGIIFEEHVFGAFCRLPARPDRLADLQLSKRHELEKPADTSFFSILKARDGEALINSFSPRDEVQSRIGLPKPIP